jgi:hypothetical protein
MLPLKMLLVLPAGHSTQADQRNNRCEEALSLRAPTEADAEEVYSGALSRGAASLLVAPSLLSTAFDAGTALIL